MLSVALTPDGRWVLSGSKDRGVQFWDPQSGNTQLMLQGHKNSGTCLRRLVLVTLVWIRLTRVSVCHRSYLGRTKSDGYPFCDGQRRYAGPNLEVSLRVFFLIFSPHYSLCHSPEISPPSPLSRPLALAARVLLVYPTQWASLHDPHASATALGHARPAVSCENFFVQADVLFFQHQLQALSWPMSESPRAPAQSNLSRHRLTAS